MLSSFNACGVLFGKSRGCTKHIVLLALRHFTMKTVALVLSVFLAVAFGDPIAIQPCKDCKLPAVQSRWGLIS